MGTVLQPDDIDDLVRATEHNQDRGKVVQIVQEDAFYQFWDMDINTDRMATWS
ncbi:hypothetical protein LCGC14_2546300, partial [marine sediment metagenome]